MGIELHEDYSDAVKLEERTRQIMTEKGLGRHQAHILACRELGMTEDDRGSGRLHRMAGLVLLGLLLLTGPAFAGSRDEFPGGSWPGSDCPDNAQPKALDDRGSGR